MRRFAMMLKLALLLLNVLQRNGTAAGTCILFCSSQHHAIGGAIAAGP